jgi:hypothetical protein
MLTISQIAAVLGLLLAFNVPQSTVSNVQAILMAPHAVTTPISQNQPEIGGPSSTVSPTQVQDTPVQVPVPSKQLLLTHNSPRADKDSLIVTITPLVNGIVDKTAHILVTTDAPWWFPHGATVCNSGCNIGINQPFNVGTPSDPSSYPMTATWGDISTTTIIDVTP